MRKRTLTYESGSSESGVSKRTWLGVFLGDKSSGRAVKRNWFNSSKRKYYRNRNVWMCKKCAGKEDASAKRQKRKDRIYYLIITVFVLWFLEYIGYFKALVPELY
jgi:hypothetical protein